ncbi:hypothetical protein PRIPAC_75382 [Pristionchus pacificus]|uniref:Skp1-related protein n=1 Tax=Pristionchus pacificus TaxID=54126 RepID=A0A454Y5S2_PRIPA|nr:hypothetical protein PRIPAC_75382 [Pristionchus pacificus]|eukprot:PDM81186.1 hypothetical protein PRIPAC_36189 [Pristionchus pacificus]
MARLVKLISSDSNEYPVDPKIAKMSKTVAVLMEALNMEDSEDVEVFEKNPIPLPNVEGAVLEKVLEWCNQHKNDPAPQEEEEENHDVPECDKEFLKVEQKILFDLMLASNYMDIKGLMDSVAKMIASMIKGKTTEEIRATFNIVNDFTPEEEEKIRKENAWADN